MTNICLMPQLSTINCFKRHPNSGVTPVSNSKRGAGCSKSIDLTLPGAGVLWEGQFPAGAQFLRIAQTSTPLPPGHNGLVSSVMGRWPQNHMRPWPEGEYQGSGYF